MTPRRQQLEAIIESSSLSSVVQTLIHICHDRADASAREDMAECWRRCAQSLDRAHQQIGATVL